MEEQRIAEQEQSTATIIGIVHTVKHAKLIETACKLEMLDYVLLDGPRSSLDNKLQAIAELARRLKTENDPDVIRAGLDEIARIAEATTLQRAMDAMIADLAPPADAEETRNAV